MYTLNLSQVMLCCCNRYSSQRKTTCLSRCNLKRNPPLDLYNSVSYCYSLSKTEQKLSVTVKQVQCLCAIATQTWSCKEATRQSVQQYVAQPRAFQTWDSTKKYLCLTDIFLPVFCLICSWPQHTLQTDKYHSHMTKSGLH